MVKWNLGNRTDEKRPEAWGLWLEAENGDRNTRGVWRVTNNSPPGQGGWDYKLQEPTPGNLRLGLAEGMISNVNQQEVIRKSLARAAQNQGFCGTGRPFPQLPCDWPLPVPKPLAHRCERGPAGERSAPPTGQVRVF